MITIIDVWDIATFDDTLRRALDDKAELIRAHADRDNEIFLEYDHGDSPRRALMRPENEHAGAFAALSEQIAALMEERVIRAWHYSRLTDDEIALFLQSGIRVSTPEMLQERINAVVAAGLLAADVAHELVAASPFNSDQRRARTGKFYMVSHPEKISDSGVRGLLAYWGGEVASFFVQRQEIATPLGTIGAPRILEVAVPIAATGRAHGAAMAVLAAYTRSLGSVDSSHGFDLYVSAPLPPDSILRVHTRGESDFDSIGVTYPAGYVDVDQTFWKELTGEDD